MTDTEIRMRAMELAAQLSQAQPWDAIKLARKIHAFVTGNEPQPADVTKTVSELSDGTWAMTGDKITKIA